MLAALAAIAVASWVAWSWIGHSTGRTGSGGAQAQMDIGGPFTLTDHHGKTVTDKTYLGQYLLVYFGYGYCPDVCPTELANIAAAMDDLGDKANKVTPLFITVDPERDTVKHLAAYVKNFDPRMVGLTGSAEQIKQAAKVYRVYYRKAEPAPGNPPKDYLMDHSSVIYLMDRKGGYITHFTHRSQSEDIEAAIREHL